MQNALERRGATRRDTALLRCVQRAERRRASSRDRLQKGARRRRRRRPAPCRLCRCGGPHRPRTRDPFVFLVQRAVQPSQKLLNFTLFECPGAVADQARASLEVWWQRCCMREPDVTGLFRRATRVRHHCGAVRAAAAALAAASLFLPGDGTVWGMADPSPKASVVTRECFLIRDALTLADQLELSQYIASRDKTPTNEPRAMVPAPRTLVLGDDTPSVSYRRGDNSIVGSMVDKGLAHLEREGLASMAVAEDMSQYTTLSMATIRYEAPNGCCPPHVDHCSDSAVFLASLGRSANFMVRGKGERDVHRFQMRSGDVLVFNASTEAAILHGVESIDEGASEAGDALASAFPVFRTHRYGVQCRIRY